VTDYLLELYVAQADAQAVAGDALRVRRASEERTRQGTHVRYLRSIFVPDDETCLMIFEAASAEAVRDVARLADLSFDHVSLAIQSAA
jgi:hypothetical protein